MLRLVLFLGLAEDNTKLCCVAARAACSKCRKFLGASNPLTLVDAVSIQWNDCLTDRDERSFSKSRYLEDEDSTASCLCTTGFCSEKLPNASYSAKKLGRVSMAVLASTFPWKPATVGAAAARKCAPYTLDTSSMHRDCEAPGCKGGRGN